MDKTQTQLFHAAKLGDIVAARMAIQAGADINAKNEYHETPLHMAAMSGHVDLCKLLVEDGADVNAARLHDLRTPKDIAIEYGQDAVIAFLRNAVDTQSHADRVAGERKDKGPPQVGG